MKEIQFKVSLKETGEVIGFEILTETGWQKEYIGADKATLAFAFPFFDSNGELTRKMFTGYCLKDGTGIYVGDEISPGNFVEFSFGCFNVNGDRMLSDCLHALNKSEK